jgi:hypothetical protein
LDDQGGGELLGPGSHKVGAGIVAASQAGAGFVRSIVAQPVGLGHPGNNCLSDGQVGLDPANGKRPQEQPPKITIGAVEEGGGG